jgi:hypothetical protein
MRNVFSAVPGKHVWVSGLHSGGLVGAISMRSSVEDKVA